jgi:hypothetical protein
MAKAKELEASLLYPREVSLKNGLNVSLRLMEAGDRQSVLNFARSLPPDDLLFLRTDITEPKTIDAWIQNIEEGTTITVLAELNRNVAAMPVFIRMGRDGHAASARFESRWAAEIEELGLGNALSAKSFGSVRTLDSRRWRR